MPSTSHMYKAGYKWQSEAFGIKVVGTDKAKSKLTWVATVIAELLDQNNDGCQDDPNVEKALRNSLLDIEIGMLIHVQEEVGHSSENRSLCLMKCSSENSTWVFIFQKYGKF